MSKEYKKVKTGRGDVGVCTFCGHEGRVVSLGQGVPPNDNNVHIPLNDLPKLIKRLKRVIREELGKGERDVNN